jgi:hypothetical protein
MRTQTDQTKSSFDQRLVQEALRIREQVKSLPLGRERELLVRKARQLDTASHINEWLSSPGLKVPQIVQLSC